MTVPVDARGQASAKLVAGIAGRVADVILCSPPARPCAAAPATSERAAAASSVGDLRVAGRSDPEGC